VSALGLSSTIGGFALVEKGCSIRHEVATGFAPVLMGSSTPSGFRECGRAPVVVTRTTTILQNKTMKSKTMISYAF
jgi:hypothetical protein